MSFQVAASGRQVLLFSGYKVTHTFIVDDNDAASKRRFRSASASYVEYSVQGPDREDMISKGNWNGNSLRTGLGFIYYLRYSRLAYLKS